MEKGLGFAVIFLIWGGALYLLLGGAFSPNIDSSSGGGGFLASSLANFEQKFGSENEALGIFDQDGSYSRSILRSGKSVSVNNIAASLTDRDLIFASSDKGLLVSRDEGLNWQFFSDVEQKIKGSVYQVSFDPGGGAYVSVYSGGKGTFYFSKDNFLTVESLFESDGKAVTAFALSGDSVYLGLSDGQVFLYSLSQKNFRKLFSFSSALTSIQAGRSNPYLLYAITRSGGFWISRDAGVSFKEANYLNKYSGAEKINHFFVSPFNDSLIFAATEYGLIKSMDGGNTWKVFKSLPSEKAEIYSVYYDSRSSTIYASSNGKLYVNREGDLNWKIFNTGLERNISAINLVNGKIIIGTED